MTEIHTKRDFIPLFTAGQRCCLFAGLVVLGGLFVHAYHNPPVQLPATLPSRAPDFWNGERIRTALLVDAVVMATTGAVLCFDRRIAARLNRVQRVILVLAFLVVAGTALFPPTAWTEVHRDPDGPSFVVDQHGIYHSPDSFFFRQGLRFAINADDGRVLWSVLAAEWTLLVAVVACLVYFCRSRRSLPASTMTAA